MRSTINYLFFFLFTYSISAQVIKVKYDSATELFTILNCQSATSTDCPEFNGDIEPGKTYEVIISGINTAVTKTILKIKPFILESSTPTIIQPIFPGITSSGQISFPSQAVASSSASFSDLDILATQANSFYKNLLKIKTQSNDLYKKTVFSVDNAEASRIFSVICSYFPLSSSTDKDKIAEMNQIITSNQNYILSVREIFAKRFENSTSIPTDIVEKYGYVILLANSVSKTDFTKYSSFIYNSITSKKQTEPEKFTAESDGSDLNILLVNTYKNDTIAKKTFDFYTKNNWSFDFSTGFFYSDEVEQSYYIESREGDNSKSNILKESKRDFDVSFGALGHLSYKFSSRIKGGISMGASLSPIDGKTRYLLGGSLIFGRKKQLALNAGISLVKIKVLSDSVSQDEIGNYVDVSVTSVPTYEKTQSGFFFGVTYNLTAKKKYE